MLRLEQYAVTCVQAHPHFGGQRLRRITPLSTKALEQAIRGVREEENDEHHLHHLLVAGFSGLFLCPVLGLQPWAGESAGLPR